MRVFRIGPGFGGTRSVTCRASGACDARHGSHPWRDRRPHARRARHRELVFASAAGYVPFAPGRIYSLREREPYDALSDRFLRAFESSLKFFRTWERVREANLLPRARCC